MAKDPVARYLLHRTSRLERRARLRPMESTEILDLAMRVYQNFGWTMLRATALPAVFCFSAIAFLTQFVLPSFFQTSHANDVSAQVGEAMVTLALGLGVGGPLFLIGMSYANAVTLFLVRDFLEGRVPSEEMAHRSARRSLGRLFALGVREMLQAGLGLLIGFGALAAGALLSDTLDRQSTAPAWLAVLAILAITAGALALPFVLGRHALAPAAVCLEDLRASQAVRRSVELLRGTGWTPSGYGAVLLLFGVLALLLLMIWIGAAMSLGMFQALDHAQGLSDWPYVGPVLAKTVEVLPFFLAVWTIIPVWSVTTTLLYFERRIRLEGYDISALAREVWRTDRQNRFEL